MLGFCWLNKQRDKRKDIGNIEVLYRGFVIHLLFGLRIFICCLLKIKNNCFRNKNPFTQSNLQCKCCINIPLITCQSLVPKKSTRISAAQCTNSLRAIDTRINATCTMRVTHSNSHHFVFDIILPALHSFGRIDASPVPVMRLRLTFAFRLA